MITKVPTIYQLLSQERLNDSVKRRIQYIRDQAYMSAYAAGAKPEDYEQFIRGEQREEYDNLLKRLEEIRG